MLNLDELRKRARSHRGSENPSSSNNTELLAQVNRLNAELDSVRGQLNKIVAERIEAVKKGALPDMSMEAEFEARIKALQAELDGKVSSTPPDLRGSNRTPGDPTSVRTQGRGWLQAAVGKTQPTELGRGSNPWFAERRDVFPGKHMPVESVAIAEYEKRIADILKGVAEDEDAARNIQTELHTLLKGIQTPQFRKELEELASHIREIQSGIPPEERTTYAQGVLEHVRKGGSLDDLAGSNPIARIALLHSDSTLRGHLEHARATEKNTAIPAPSLQARGAWGVGTTIAAVATILASVGVTKTGTEQGLDLIQSQEKFGAGLIDFTTRMFEQAGYDPTSARGAAIFTLAVVASGTASGVIAYGKATWGRLGKGARTTVLAAGLYSAGFGVVGLNNKIIDAQTIGDTGRAVETKMEPMRQKAEEVKASLAKLFAELESLTDAAIAAEMNKKAYAHRTALLDAALQGAYDEQKRLVGTATLNNPDASHASHEKYQEALVKLKEESGLSADQGLKDLIKRFEERINFELAPRMIEAAVEIGKRVGSDTFTAHLLGALNPTEQTVTPMSMYKAAEAARDEFLKLVETYEKVRTEANTAIGAYLDGIVKIGGAGGGDMNSLKQQLAARFGGLGVTTEEVEDALKGIPQPEGRFVWLPDEKAWQDIQNSLNTTWIGKSGVDVANNAWWATAYGGALLVCFGLLDYGTGASSYYLNRSRRRKFAREFPAQESALNDAESEIASRIEGVLEASMQRLRSIVGDSPLHRPIPSLVAQLHIRRELREQFIEESGLKPSKGVGSFVHGFVFGETPEYIRLYSDYRAWLLEKVGGLQSNPSETIASIVGGLYPKYPDAIELVNTYERAQSDTRQLLRTALEDRTNDLRREQLRNYAQAINERLMLLKLSDEGLSRQVPGADEGVWRPPVVRFEPGKPVVVSRDIALEAFALADVRDEIHALSETLKEISALGIAPEVPSSTTAGEVHIGPWKLGAKQAIQDELVRADKAHAAGQSRITGSPEDFQRFDDHMTTIARAVDRVQGHVLEQSPLLKEYIPVFEYRRDAGLSGYTIFVELYRDTYEKPVATLRFKEIVPDFSDDAPGVQAERLKTWLAAGSDAERGLIAQASHSALLEEYRKVLDSVRDVPIATNGRKTPVDTKALATIQETLRLSGIIATQEPLMELARSGGTIEESKFKIFLEPTSRISNRTAFANFSSVIKDIQSIDLPQDITITYTPLTERLHISRGRARGVGRSVRPEESLSIHSYDRESLNEVFERLNPDTSSR